MAPVLAGVSWNNVQYPDAGCLIRPDGLLLRGGILNNKKTPAPLLGQESHSCGTTRFGPGMQDPLCQIPVMRCTCRDLFS